MPSAPRLEGQEVDVRDVARWLVGVAERRVTGTFDVVGPAVPYANWGQASREVGGHRGRVVRADGDWLVGQGVAQYMGAGSLALWHTTDRPARSGQAPRRAGLSLERERSLLAALEGRS